MGCPCAHSEWAVRLGGKEGVLNRILTAPTITLLLLQGLLRRGKSRQPYYNHYLVASTSSRTYASDICRISATDVCIVSTPIVCAFMCSALVVYMYMHVVEAENKSRRNPAYMH